MHLALVNPGLTGEVLVPDAPQIRFDNNSFNPFPLGEITGL